MLPTCYQRQANVIEKASSFSCQMKKLHFLYMYISKHPPQLAHPHAEVGVCIIRLHEADYYILHQVCCVSMFVERLQHPRRGPSAMLGSGCGYLQRGSKAERPAGARCFQRAALYKELPSSTISVATTECCRPPAIQIVNWLYPCL